ncbi:uncharacterized protein LOC143305497 isoform X2 [Osmia lignaria lignaria]|uniref:uncharacterized protein LOC143305497 isoform X2 n=1 Tax=Osmia lignaria lignaria TaxID=1437193 RepID=UPI00402BB433
MWKRKLQADRTWRTLLPSTSRPWASSNSVACARIETSSEVANLVPVFREEGFIEESSFLVDVTLCGNENCKQIEPGGRYCPQPADHGHLRILLLVRVSRQVLKLRIRCSFSAKKVSLKNHRVWSTLLYVETKTASRSNLENVITLNQQTMGIFEFCCLCAYRDKF